MRKTTSLMFKVIQSFCKKDDDPLVPYNNQLSTSESFSIDLSFQQPNYKNSFLKTLYQKMRNLFTKRNRTPRLSFSELETLETSFEESQILNESFSARSINSEGDEVQTGNEIQKNNSAILKKIYFKQSPRNLQSENKLNQQSMLGKLLDRSKYNQIQLNNQMQVMNNIRGKKVPQYSIQKAPDGTIYATQLSNNNANNKAIFQDKENLPKANCSLANYQQINEKFQKQQKESQEILSDEIQKLFPDKKSQQYSEKIEKVIDILKRKRIYQQPAARMKKFQPTKLTPILENVEY